MAAKMTSGNGWSFEPASGGKNTPETVSLPDDKQRVAIRLEKRAKGKEVTAVTGFVLSSADRKKLAAELKKACGSGGADGDGFIDIQGDRREAVAGLLMAKGWRIR